MVPAKRNPFLSHLPSLNLIFSGRATLKIVSTTILVKDKCLMESFVPKTIPSLHGTIKGIIEFNKAEEAVKKIFVGTKNVTSCICGDDDLQTLYITTASDKINRGGHLYKFRNDIPGLPSSEFKFL